MEQEIISYHAMPHVSMTCHATPCHDMSCLPLHICSNPFSRGISKSIFILHGMHQQIHMTCASSHQHIGKPDSSQKGSYPEFEFRFNGSGWTLLVGQITPSQKAWHFEDLTTDPLVQTQYGPGRSRPPPSDFGGGGRSMCAGHSVRGRRALGGGLIIP